MVNEVYNTDCFSAIKQMLDNTFDLAVIDPPYGIKQSGSKNKSRSCLAESKDYHAFYGGDQSAPDEEFFLELQRVSKNQIIFGTNHFIDKLPPQEIVIAGLFGIKKMEKMTLPIVNWRGRLFLQRCGFFVSDGRECCRVT